jgi:hypothetical protein
VVSRDSISLAMIGEVSLLPLREFIDIERVRNTPLLEQSPFAITADQ